MSDEIFRLLPVLISPVSHDKLPHSENGNGWRWGREGGADGGGEGYLAGGGGGGHTSTASPLRKKNSRGKSNSGDPDMESHLGEHIDLIYKTSALMQNKWRGRELVLNHKTPALLRLR